MENEFKYEINVGFKLNDETKSLEPKQRIFITQDQFEIIELFADRAKDRDLNTIYKINSVQFTVMPLMEKVYRAS